MAVPHDLVVDEVTAVRGTGGGNAQVSSNGLTNGRGGDLWRVDPRLSCSVASVLAEDLPACQVIGVPWARNSPWS